MAYALDRVALNKVINKGLYKIANTVWHRLGPHELVDGYPNYDPAKAKQLLADYGKPVKIKRSSRSTPRSLLSGQALQQMWKKVGIETEIVQFEHAGDPRRPQDYQVMLYRWAGGADPDKNVYQFFHSKGAVNRVTYNNPEMDKLLDAARHHRYGSAPDALPQGQQPSGARPAVPAAELFRQHRARRTVGAGHRRVPDGLIRLPSVWKDK